MKTDAHAHLMNSPLAEQKIPQNNQVRLVQRGKGTLTGSELREEIRETRIQNWWKIRDLGEFDSVESALAAAEEALKKDPKAMFMVVDDQQFVLAEKLDEELHQKLEARSERLIKTLFFLICALAVGATFHTWGAATTWSALAGCVVGFYLVLRLLGSIANSVESCIAAFILTTIACLLFPTLDVISKAKARAYLKQEQRVGEAHAH